jgi:hypothetical protein
MFGRFLRVLIVTVLMAIISSGCTGKGNGILTVSITGGAVPMSSAATGIMQILVTAKQGGITETGIIRYDLGETSFTFDTVLAGIWTIEAIGNNAGGKTIYYGKVTARVEKNQTANADLAINPVNGTYDLNVDLTGIDPAYQATSAQVWVYPLGVGTYKEKHIITGSMSGVSAFSGISVPPGTYELQIRLYNAEGTQVYAGPWYRFDILPASVTTVNLGIDQGSFSVDMVINGMPLRPQLLDFSVSPLPDPAMMKVFARWRHTDFQNLQDVIIYAKFYEGDRYSKYFILSQSLTEYILIDIPLEKKGYAESGRVWAIIITVSKSGHQSISSNEIVYPALP